MSSTSLGFSPFTGATRHTLVALALACASTATLADNFVIRYTGSINATAPAGTTAFPEFIAGERFTLSLIMNSTGSTAASQTWGSSTLTCAIWHINDAQSEVITFDGATAFTATGSGSFVTDASGNLTAAPTYLEFSAISLPSTGIAQPAGSVNLGSGTFAWMVRADLSGATPLITDGTRTLTADTSTMTLASAWTTPRAVSNTADCATLAGQLSAAPAVPANTAAIPVLGAPGLVLLGTLTGLLGWRRMGRRSRAGQ